MSFWEIIILDILIVLQVIAIWFIASLIKSTHRIKIYDSKIIANGDKKWNKNKSQILKISFLKSFYTDEHSYHEWKRFSIAFSIVYTLSISITWFLSFFIHSNIVYKFVFWYSGFSLFSFIYVISLVLSLDFPLKPFKIKGDYRIKPVKIITGIFNLIIIFSGFILIFKTEHHRRDYQYQCSTVLADPVTKVSHLDIWYEDCDSIKDFDNLIETKGYIADQKGYRRCQGCIDAYLEAEAEH